MMIMSFNPEKPEVVTLKAEVECSTCKAHPRPFTLHCIKCHVTFRYDMIHKCQEKKEDENHLHS